MAKLAIILVTLFFSLTFVSCDDVPVLLFGKSLPFKVPALKTLGSDEFSNLVKAQVTEDTITVVFLEPKLSVEDLTQCKSNDGVTCFKQLAAFNEKSYLPSVSDPVNGLFDNLESNYATIDESDDIQEALDNGNRVIFVYLDNAESKNDFESHDEIIGQTFAKLSKKYKNIVAIYTGQHSSLTHNSRSKRQVEGKETRKGEINQPPKSCDNFVIAAEKIITKKDGAENAVDLTDCKRTGWDAAKKVLTVKLLPTDLELEFKEVAGTWSLSGAKEGETVYKYPLYIYANRDYAYRCGGNYTFTDAKGNTIKIKNSQMLPDFKEGVKPTFIKDKYVHCEGYWSPGILAGLFVVILLLVIMAVGLSWIMDINTMDKFDDPKGKTITINANE